jgi:hypothetical protein
VARCGGTGEWRIEEERVNDKIHDSYDLNTIARMKPTTAYTNHLNRD